MASTDTDICNMALMYIGEGVNLISSLDEDSTEAKTCKFWFDRRRDLLMEVWPWEVAKEYATLTLVANDPNPDWRYSYRYPTDCLFAERVLKGGDNTRYPESDPRVPFTTGQDDQGWLIFTDQTPACLKYVRRLTNTAYWKESFIDALAWSMAGVLALPLGRAVAFMTNADAKYQAALADAESVSANEPTDDPEEPSNAIRDRQGVPGGSYTRPIGG